MSRAAGYAAEEMAASFLEEQGFTILARNYTIRGAEVDIIAREAETIVFVEVKQRKSSRYAAPRESVTLAKQRRISRAALVWLQREGLGDAPVRFDIVEVLPDGIALLRGAFFFADPSSG